MNFTYLKHTKDDDDDDDLITSNKKIKLNNNEGIK